MTPSLVAEQLTFFRVLWLAVAARFGWTFAGVALDQLEHWVDLAISALRRWQASRDARRLA
jgi:hypothetical protein